MPPRFSPAPAWEALKGTATPTATTDSSEEDEEDEIVDDTASSGIQASPQPQASLKRKETEHVGTSSKRPRHEQDRREEKYFRNAEKRMGSPFPYWKIPPVVDNATPSSSKTNQTSKQNVNQAAPSGPRVASSSTAPPLSSVKTGASDQNPKHPLPLPERIKPIPKFKKPSSQSTASPSKTSLTTEGTQGLPFKRKEFPSTLSANLFGRNPSSQAGPSKQSVSSKASASKSQDTRRKSLSNDIIDLCDADSPPPAPKPKQRMSLPNAVIDMAEEAHPGPRKWLARKSVGGKPPRKHSPQPPIQAPNDNEVIEISSSDEDDVPTTKPTSKPTSKNNGKSAGKQPDSSVILRTPVTPVKNQKKALNSKSASESNSMKVDQMLLSKSKPSAPTTASGPKKLSITGLREDMQLNDFPKSGSSTLTQIQPLPQALAESAKVLQTSESMEVGNEDIPHIPVVQPKLRTDVIKSQPSLSKPPQIVSRAAVATPNVASGSSLVKKSKPLSTSSDSSTATKFSRRQVAVKSAALKRRLQWVSTSSSGSGNSDPDSDDERDEDDDDDDDEEEGKDEPRPNTTAAIAEKKGKEPEKHAEKVVDMRSLDQALGLEDPHVPPVPKTPERTIRVKEQPLSPELFPKKKVQTSQKLSLSSPRSGLLFQSRGDTVESAIDLTSDNEDPSMEPISSAAVNSSKSPGTPPKWKGKGRALPEPSATPPPQSEPEELLLRPSDTEHSLPPPSPSPTKTPLLPESSNPDSGTTLAEERRKSAPLVLSQDTTTHLFDPSRIKGALPVTPKTTSPAKGHVRSISLGSQAQLSFDDTTVRDRGIISDSRVMHAFSAASQASATSQADAITSGQTLQSFRNDARPISPLSTSGPSTSTIPKGPTVTKDLDLISDAFEMGNWESDNDAMEETEEALMELSEEDIYVVAQGPGAASDFSEFDGSTEAGPSNNRSPSRPEGPSRRSSHSSASDEERVPSEDDLINFDSDFPSRNTSPEEFPVPAVTGGKTLGGFPAITWKEYRQNLANFTPKVYYGRNLPHSLQDQINNMSELTRKMPELRKVFEAMIQENTFENEPNAPKIELFNDIDDEPTPPWEFHYTNEMWHAEGVPPPDIKNLTSCNCKGACNPKSKTCACLKRQREALTDPNAEFMYDKAGRLRLPGWPVNECNDLCGCGDECRNRVVQHGRKVQIFIQKTEHKGWGVFAGSKKIPKGTFIGIYSGELLTDNEAHDRGINYNKFGRTYLFDLDFHHLREGEGWTSNFTVDAYHAGNFTRFLNHSCDPNCILQPIYINEGNLEKPLLVIFSDRDIEANEEICFNYSGDPDDGGEEEEEEDGEPGSPETADKIYGRCMCGARNCTGNMFKRPS